MKIILILLAFCMYSQVLSDSMTYDEQIKTFHNLYTTQKQMHKNVQNLAEKECSDILSISILDDLDQKEKELQLKLITINDPSQTSPKLKAYYLFGEHPREIISSELAQYFLADICKGYNQKEDHVMKMLKDYTLLIVFDANPLGRKKVDDGDLCNRVNENGVDLNRNYDSNWQKMDESNISDQTYSGKEPFSEKQTKAFKKKILQQHKIDLFLTVHSGAYGLYTPHAYDFETGEKNKHNLELINNKMNDYFCRCDHGCAGKLVGYLCPGTCLDYAYDQANVINSFAWEIHDETTIDNMIELFPINNSNRLLKTKKMLKKSSFMQLKDVSQMNLGSGISHQMKLEAKAKDTGDSGCFSYFNPINKKQLSWSLAHFSKALYSLMDFTKETMK